jgi:glycosyltransferase involved in cell wall biosynthesis
MSAPGVLMVTGAYWPELSGGGLQCRTMIHTLRDRLSFRVLTTCTDATLPQEDVVEGTPVTRLFVDVGSRLSKLAVALRTIRFFVRMESSLQIVHLHGFSQKSILIAVLASLFGKRIIVTIHTAGQDDPDGVRRQGALAYWAYRRADRFIAISELMADNYRAAGLDPEKLRVCPNGIDTDRFQPATEADRVRLKTAVGHFPAQLPWILSVGFFSRDKSPDVLYEAWVLLRERYGVETALVFAGATASIYQEIDAGLMTKIVADAEARGLRHLLHFTGEVKDIERYYCAADIFVMPSIREAFGMALVEAMASALPVIATRITGVTDRIVQDRVTGDLVPPKDAPAIAEALRRTLSDPARAAAMGAEARRDVDARYGLAASRERWHRIYAELVQT